MCGPGNYFFPRSSVLSILIHTKKNTRLNCMLLLLYSLTRSENIQHVDQDVLILQLAETIF